MFRLAFVGCLAALLLAGCSKEAPQDPRNAVKLEGDTKVEPRGPIETVPVANPGDAASAKAYETLISNLAVPTKQQDYDAALLVALNLLAKGDRAGALTALETARGIQDTPELRQQIDSTRLALAQQNAAKRTVQDIRAILDAGNPQEASRLAASALQQYGGSDVAGDLTQLKQQADALIVAPMNNNAAQRVLFLQQAEAALKDNNLRTAALAYDQVLGFGDDAATQKKSDELKAALTRYDDNRRRAAELRRDAANLEDALAALQEADKAWDTPQVRGEIDECSLALQKRRERLSVSDFEVRGDLGAAQAGKSVAEDLLPAFKARFDLVEREQIGKVFEELKLEANAVAYSPEGREAFGRLAKVRYLVVGSITPQQGVTVNARLVDVRSGLIVQTARLSAPSLDALSPRLPQLAQMLMMTDEQKLAFEQQVAALQPVIRPIEITAALPPPPPVQVEAVPPPPIVTYTQARPALGGLVIEDFRRFTAVVVEAPPPPPLEIVLRREDPRRQRLFQLSLELGDNLFRRGRHAEAERHFQLALTLTDNRRDVEVRLERCRPFIPPPLPVVIVQQPVVFVPPPPPVRGRLAVFNFFINAAPGLVPLATDSWAADSFAAYCGKRYEIIDRGEVCWYMGRLGITMRDVLNDPGARVALAQALNARYFVFGAMVQTGSFDVTTDLVDAQSGAHTGKGMIHVQDHNEMKVRMNELFGQLNLAPEQQAQAMQQGKDGEKVQNDIRKLQQNGQYEQAAAAAREALKTNPSSVALQQLQADNTRLAEQARIAAQRKQQEQQHAAEVQAAKERDLQLAKQAEQARLLAEQEAKLRSEATKHAQEAAQKQAYDQFLTRGRDALKRHDYPVAVQALQSANALRPNDEAGRELQQAQAQAAQAAKERALQDQQQREAQAKKERDAVLARADAERKQREAADAAQHKAQQDRDDAEYKRLLGEATQALAKQQFDAARAAVASAKLIKAGPESDALLRQIHDQQALADAKKKSDQAHLEEEKKQAAERKQRADADAAAKLTQEKYTAALTQAQKAQAAKQYDQAIAAYQEAGKLFRTDAVLSGIKQSQDLRDRAQHDASAQAKAEADRLQRVKELVAAVQRDIGTKDLKAADQALAEALKLAPTDPAVVKAQQDVALAHKSIVDKTEADRTQKVKDLVAGVHRGIDAKDLKAADQALAEAMKLAPTDPAVVKAQQDVAFAHKGVADGDALKAKKANYDLAMSAGAAALKAKNYPGAVNSYTEALRQLPGDKDAAAQLKEAERQQAAAKATQDADTKRREDYARFLKDAQTAQTAKKYDEAVRLFAEALKVQPNDPVALKGERDAQAALDAAKNDVAAKKRLADYQAALQTARAALVAKKYDEAVQHANDALKLQPNDKDATTFIREVEKAKADAKAAQDNDAAAKKRLADYQAALQAARAALVAKKYDEAVQHANDALKLQPNDKDATAVIKEVDKAKADAKAAQDADAKRKLDAFNKAMADGANFEKQKQWTPALTAYREALKQQPGDVKAVAAEKNASFQVHMAEGQRLAGLKKFPDAAKEYDEAVKLFPDNKDAKDALKRAKDGKP